MALEAIILQINPFGKRFYKFNNYFHQTETLASPFKNILLSFSSSECKERAEAKGFDSLLRGFISSHDLVLSERAMRFYLTNNGLQGD